MKNRLKKEFDSLRADSDMQEVVRGTILAFVLKIVGAALAFSFSVYVARLLGVNGAGIYFLALSITVIGSVVGRVGLDNALLRFVATHANLGEWEKVRAVHAIGIRLAVIVSSALSSIGFLAAGWISEVLFRNPELAEPLRWMSLAIVPFSMLNLQAQSLKGLRHIRDALLLQSIGVPLLAIILIWSLASEGGVGGVSWSYLTATTIVALLGVWVWRRSNGDAVGNLSSAISSYPIKELWASCRPLWGASLLNGAILPWLPLLLLGVWSTSDEVGVFGAALRMAMLVSFFLVAVISVVAPKFAVLYADDDRKTLGRVARRSALMLTIFASTLVLPMIFAGDFLMSLFGDEFVVGAKVLAILAFGQWVNAFCGPVGSLLVMSGHEQKLTNATIGAFIVQLGLCVGLIPSLGMVGAAIAATIAGIVSNVLAVFYVRRYIGIAYPTKMGGDDA